MNPAVAQPTDGKKVFKELGTCSRTFHFLLNREFGHNRPGEERASDTLAGGILREGHQCGMLWGASLAIGAEAYRTCKDRDQAIRAAVAATQTVMQSFREREGTINCREITHCDFSSRWSFAKYMITRRYRHCFTLAQEWAPKAVQAAREGLQASGQAGPCRSCAAEVAERMGATEEQAIMVSGFAGGLGLSGGGCGALAAAVWMQALKWSREEDRSPYDNPDSQRTLETFLQATHGKMTCREISGKRFQTVDAHTRFLDQDGCDALMKVLEMG